MDKQLNLSIFPRLDLFNYKTRMIIFFLTSASKGRRIKWNSALGKSFVNFKAPTRVYFM